MSTEKTLQSQNSSKVKFRFVLGICLVVLFSFLLVCISTGLIAPISKFLYGAFGISVFGLVAAGIAFGIFLILNKIINIKLGYVVNFVLMYFLIVLLVHTMTSSIMISSSQDFGQYLSKLYNYTQNDYATISFGGVVSGIFIYPIYSNLTGWGTYCLLLLALLVTLFIATNFFVKYNSNHAEHSSVFYVSQNSNPDAKSESKVKQPQSDVSQTFSQEELYSKLVGSSNPEKPQPTQPDNKTSAIEELYGTKVSSQNFDTNTLSNTQQNTKTDYETVPKSKNPVDELYDIKPMSQEEIEKQKRNEQLIKDFYKLKANGTKIPNSSPIINGDAVSEKMRDGTLSQGNQGTVEVFEVPIQAPTNQNNSNNTSENQNTDDYSEVFMEIVPSKENGLTSPSFDKPKNEQVVSIPNNDILKNNNDDNQALSQDEEISFIEEPTIVDFDETDDSCLEESESNNLAPKEEQPNQTQDIKKPVDTVSEEVEDQNDKNEESLQDNDSDSMLVEEEISGNTTGKQTRLNIFGGKKDDKNEEEKEDLIIYPPYDAPPIDLLSDKQMVLSNSPEEVEKNKSIIESVLGEFNIEAKVENAIVGPTVTRYEISLGKGMSVKRIVPLSDDIAMRLSSSDKIILDTPIPGKDLAGIEVPNKKSSIVPARLLLDSQEFKNAQGGLCFCVGIDINGNKIIADLAAMPHILVAGGTGSGKSVALDLMLTSFLMKYSPEELRIILVDPKLVGFGAYEGLPHFLINEILSDPEKVLSTFKWLINEMERRYKLLRNAGVRDLAAYNEVIDPYKTQKLPRIVLVVDELLDLMTYNKNDLEPMILRLAAKARAAGIHLVLAMQRPSVDVLSGNIKNNFGWRIALKVASNIDSKTIIGFGGAEKLLGKGDMLFKMDTSPDPLRIQGGFIDTVEVAQIVDYIKSNNECHFMTSAENKILKRKDANSVLGKDPNSDEKLDDLFVDALKFCIESKAASISMIQRRYKLGWGRAGKIISDMEMFNFVSPQEGTKPRDMYITMEKFEELFGGD